MSGRLTMLGILLVCGVVAAPARAQTPLTLDAVIDAVDRAFPLLDAARRDEELAAGQALAARGAFDLRLTATADRQGGAGYNNDTAAVSLLQPLTFAGATVFGGYGIGRGTFPPYGAKPQTLTDGEWRAGVSLPLLRNRALDSRRGALERTELGRRIAEQRVDAARLRFRGEAALRYWDWVAAGQLSTLATQLLTIAEVRDRDLADAIALGQVAPIERVDNRRAILQRQSGVVTARRQTERQAIGLSLYYRNDDGTMRAPEPSALPASLPPPPPPLAPDQIEADIARALVERPDVQAIVQQRRQQEVALDLARNDLLPALDLRTQVARDSGQGPAALRGTEVEAGVAFVLPVQRRQAKGDEQAALAVLARIDAELRFARDRVRTEVEDAASALAAAAEVVSLLSTEVSVAQDLEQAERERFTLGDSTQFLVNLRELATADAAARLIAATADAHKARVVYDVATGAALQPRRVP